MWKKEMRTIKGENMRYGYRSVTPYTILVYCALYPGLHSVKELESMMFVNVARKYVRLLSNEGALTLYRRLQGYRYGFVDCSEYHECRQYRYEALRRRIAEVMPILARIVEIVTKKRMPLERRVYKMVEDGTQTMQNGGKRGESTDKGEAESME